MRKIEFDIKLRTKDLFLYTMYHTYLCLSGVFGLLISIGSFVFFLLNLGKVPASTLCVLLMVALLFPVVQPVLLFFKCSRQIKKSKDINEALHYTLTGEKIEISQGDKKAEVHWFEIRKAVYLKNVIYLYMSPVRAFIFPKDFCTGQFDAMIKLVKESMEKYKDYEPEDTELETAGEVEAENSDAESGETDSGEENYAADSDEISEEEGESDSDEISEEEREEDDGNDMGEQFGTGNL